jgi:hypothetical protein
MSTIKLLGVGFGAIAIALGAVGSYLGVQHSDPSLFGTGVMMTVSGGIMIGFYASGIRIL